MELRYPRREFITRREAMQAAASAANAGVRKVIATARSMTSLCRSLVVFMNGRIRKEVRGASVMRCENWRFTEPTTPSRWRYRLLAGYELAQ